MRLERRRTRESLTRTLARVAARIAEAPSRRVEWTDRRLGSRQTSTVTAKRLWVAGSYARGAAECGDLDLIVEAEIDGVYPPSRTIAKSLFGATQDTSLYIGTPHLNTSNVAFPEARLVWAEDSHGWRANVAAIAVDPEAGRFARATDELPLRPDQLSTSLAQLDELLELRRGGVLEWEFVDAADVNEEPDALRRAGLREELYGAKTRDALQLAICHHASTRRGGKWMPLDASERTRFRCRGTLFLTGFPPIPVYELDSPFYETLALAPHRSRRGPNGIWLIRRGPEHPVEKLFAGCRAFYVTCGGAPFHFSDVTHSEVKPATGIELFRTEGDAVDEAEMARDFAERDEPIEVVSASGSELLRLIAGCDLVLVDGAIIALSRTGQVAADEEVGISDAREVAAALTVD